MQLYKRGCPRGVADISRMQEYTFVFVFVSVFIFVFVSVFVFVFVFVSDCIHKARCMNAVI